MDLRTCPRCQDPFDARFFVGSRAVPERDVEICAVCGTDEVEYVRLGLPVPSVADWPVTWLDV